MNPVLLPWIIEVGVITYRTMTGTTFIVTRQGATGPFGLAVQQTSSGVKRPPLPSELLATFIAFGAFGFIAEGEGNRRRIGALLGWGIVAATILTLVSGGTPAANTSITGSNTRVLGTPPPLTQPLPAQPPISRSPTQ